MKEPSPNINRYWADLVVEELVRNGVQYFFLAPGSRNAPLATAVAANERARSITHFDERGTCFMALGSGKRTGIPAVWITTSGTAVANGLPAVVEASQSSIPLIVLTADRPFELRDVGANQAIDQIGIFGKYVRWSIDLPAPSAAVPPESILSTVDQAVTRAIGSESGPVHVNMPFREPLAPVEASFDVGEEGIRRWLASEQPYTQVIRGRQHPHDADLIAIGEAVEKARRGLLVVGGLSDRETADALVRMAERWQWPVVADVSSQVRLGARSDLVVDSPHFLVKHGSIEAPDVVLRFGSQVSSKAINTQLAAWKPGLHVVIGERAGRNDAEHVATHQVVANGVVFADVAASWDVRPNPTWPAKWKSMDLTDILSSLVSAEAPVTEPGIARSVTKLIPHDHNLYLASSMPIRDFDMFGLNSGAPCWVGANRGASGIDGTVASAVGAAIAANQRTTVVCGDLAMLHDLNSLATLANRRDVVIVLNNDGGGIFSFLPIADHPDVFEPLFGTPHGYSFESAATMFGLRFGRPETMDAFSQEYRDALNANRSTLLEIRTNRVENVALHRDLDARISALF